MSYIFVIMVFINLDIYSSDGIADRFVIFFLASLNVLSIKGLILYVFDDERENDLR